MKRSHLWILIALLFVACGGGDDGTGPGNDDGNNEPPDAQPTALGVPNGAPTIETIGAGGGSVASSDGAFTLNIPAGALAADTDITVQPLTNTAWGGIGAGYRLTPDGLAFSQPVELVLEIAPDDLAGSDPLAVDIAVQDDAGFWFILKNRSYDEGAGTLTCTTTHFSDYAGVEGVQIRPPVATVGVSGTVNLSVQNCEYQEISNDPNISAALLICSSNVYTNLITEWSVNGIPGGSASVGTVATTGNSVSARYTAPAAVPLPSTLAVSAKWTSRSATVILVSNVTIFSGFSGTVTHFGPDNSSDVPDTTIYTLAWESDGSGGSIETFTGSGTVVYKPIHQTDCAPTEFTPNNAALDPLSTYMFIDRSGSSTKITVAIDVDWDVHECIQCLTDPPICQDYHFFVSFGDDLATISLDGNTITGYSLDLVTGEGWYYEFKR